VIQSLREDLLKDSKKNFDKKLDKESKSVKKKNPKFELTPPPTARHAISKGSGQLTSQEEEIYIDLTMAYRKLVSENEVYVANEKWQKILPEYLNRFGITAQEFEEISQVGDKDILLQDFIEKKIKE
jgi:superfamily II DNA helicase RecQ